jgi:hypothetical protein
MPPNWDYINCPGSHEEYLSLLMKAQCAAWVIQRALAIQPRRVRIQPRRGSSIHSRRVSINPRRVSIQWWRVSIQPRQVSISVTVKDHSHQNRLAIQLLQQLVSTLLKLLVHHPQTLCGQNDIFLWCTMLSEQRWLIQTVNTRRPFMYTSWWKSKNWRERDSSLGNILDKPESRSRQFLNQVILSNTTYVYLLIGSYLHTRYLVPVAPHQNWKLAGARFRSRKHFG